MASRKKSAEREGPRDITPRPGTTWQVGLISNAVYNRLDRIKHLPLILLVLVGSLTGALVAPELGGRHYPAGEQLLGTPAYADIKAPYDIAVPDAENTAARREAAVAGVGRVYDYDVTLAELSEKRLAIAFGNARDRLKKHASRENPPPLDNADITRQFQATLKRPVPTEDALLLAREGYSRSIETATARLIRRFQQQEIIQSHQVFARDRDTGITLQEVPNSAKSPRKVHDIYSIKDLEAVKAELVVQGPLFLKNHPPELQGLILRLSQGFLRPNLTLNRAATELDREVARLAISTEHILVKRGEMIVRDGERITKRHLVLFGALNKDSSQTQLWFGLAGATLLALLFIFTGFSAASGQRWRASLRARELLFLSGVFLLIVGACRVWMIISLAVQESHSALPLNALIYCMPIATGAMVVKLALRLEPALIFGILLSMVVGVMLNDATWYTAYGFVGSVLGAALIGAVNVRGDVIRAGVWAGAGQALFVIAYLLFEGGGEITPFLIGTLAAFLGGTLSGFVTLALTPIIELVFRYTTDLKLLELANLNHPALKELIVQAPGSYHHSIIVGSLAEAAAEVIGANPLLARVMAYYHDLGKGCNASYFIENQRSGQNPHNRLNPSMSAMILRRHVTDGLDIAKRYGLGEPIQAAIAEHHGTTLIQYFYHKHKENEEKYGPVAEHDYRYPGRKPQTRESALVMIADSIEAAARSIAEPTPARLQGLVNRIINLKFTDGQLDECDLTLRDLHIIAKAFMRVLNSIYHKRVEYPDGLKDVSARKETPGKEEPTRQGDSAPATTLPPPNHSPEESRPDNLRRLGL